MNQTDSYEACLLESVDVISITITSMSMSKENTNDTCQLLPFAESFSLSNARVVELADTYV